MGTSPALFLGYHPSPFLSLSLGIQIHSTLAKSRSLRVTDIFLISYIARRDTRILQDKIQVIALLRRESTMSSALVLLIHVGFSYLQFVSKVVVKKDTSYTKDIY